MLSIIFTEKIKGVLFFKKSGQHLLWASKIVRCQVS